MQPRAQTLQCKHFLVQLFTRRLVAGRHLRAVFQQHPDQRAVAHADAEHDGAFSSQSFKISVHTVVHSRSFFSMLLFYYICFGK